LRSWGRTCRLRSYNALVFILYRVGVVVRGALRCAQIRGRALWLPGTPFHYQGARALHTQIPHKNIAHLFVRLDQAHKLGQPAPQNNCPHA